MTDTDLRKYEDKKASRQGPMDLPFLMIVVLLAGIGLVMMFSASYASAEKLMDNPAYFVTRQGLFVLAGIAVLLIVSRVNYQLLRALSLPAMGTAVVLLILVLFIGTEIKGARRWIDLGFTSLQPSEIAKIAVIMLFAAMISARPERLTSRKAIPAIKGLMPFLLILGLIGILMALEPHFSGMILVFAVGAVMLFLGGLAWKWIVGVAAAGVGAMTLLITMTDYARARIDLWHNPWIDPQGGGWQAIQSLYAIGSGGLFGLGLGQSRQKYLYLPDAHNDFVFSIVCEELGLIGALIVLFLFMLLILRGYWIAVHSRDKFGSLLVGGVTTLLAIQTFLNVAVVTNLIPVTGISMPFFSYGGSSLLIQMTEMGIVLAVSRQMPAREAG